MTSLLSTFVPALQWPYSTFPAFVLFVACYLPLQQVLRHRRENRVIEKYGYKSRSDLARMDMDQAAEIVRMLLELEMTDAFNSSLGYGFIQTLAFPDSSALLVHTNQIHNPEESSKRLFDTETLMNQMFSFPPSSTRFREAVSRINYLHSRYGDRITNDQLIYVLGVFACNPWIWAEKWEWRKMNDLEVAAIGTFWMGVGLMMHIDMKPIHGLGRKAAKHSAYEGNLQEEESEPVSWRDGLDWMLDMRAYLLLHEHLYLSYNQDVALLTEETFRMGLISFPKWTHKFLRQIAGVQYDEKFRKAGGLEEPSEPIRRFVQTSAYLTKLFRKHLGLPRPRFLTNRSVDDKGSAVTGRYQAQVYFSYPYYVQPTIWKRWKPAAWLRWMKGLDNPGDKADKYNPEGYKVGELGPRRWKGKGRDWMAEDIQDGKQTVPVGACPFMAMKEADRL